MIAIRMVLQDRKDLGLRTNSTTILDDFGTRSKGLIHRAVREEPLWLPFGTRTDGFADTYTTDAPRQQIVQRLKRDFMTRKVNALCHPTWGTPPSN